MRNGRSCLAVSLGRDLLSARAGVSALRPAPRREPAGVTAPTRPPPGRRAPPATAARTVRPTPSAVRTRPLASRRRRPAAVKGRPRRNGFLPHQAQGPSRLGTARSTRPSGAVMRHTSRKAAVPSSAFSRVCSRSTRSNTLSATGSDSGSTPIRRRGDSASGTGTPGWRATTRSASPAKVARTASVGPSTATRSPRHAPQPASTAAVRRRAVSDPRGVR